MHTLGRAIPLLSLLLLTAPLAPGFPGPLQAQVVPHQGSLIRVFPAEGARWEGRYVDRSPSHLLAEGPLGPSQWAVEDIQRIQVGMGPHRPVARTTFITSALLAGAFALLGALTPETECDYWCYGPQTRSDGFIFGALVGATLGLPVGFVLGVIPREKWVEGTLH